MPLATISDTINGKTFTATITDGGKKIVLSQGGVSLEIRENYLPVIHKEDGTVFEMKDVVEGKITIIEYNETLQQFLDNDFRAFMDKYVSQSLIQWGYVASMNGSNVSIKNAGILPTTDVEFDFYNGKIRYNNYKDGKFSEIPFSSTNMKQLDMTQIDSIGMQDEKEAAQLIAMATMLKVSKQLSTDRVYSNVLKGMETQLSQVQSAKGNGHFSDEQVFQFAQMADLAYGKKDDDKTFYDFNDDKDLSLFLSNFASILNGYQGREYNVDNVELLKYKQNPSLIHSLLNGYQGYVLKDKLTGQVYMLHRGTEPGELVDVGQDIVMYFGLDFQSKVGIALYEEAIKEKLITGPVIHIGHSLGGGLANIVAAEFHDRVFETSVYLSKNINLINFLNRHTNRYSYDINTGKLTVVGRMTEDELKELKEYFTSENDKKLLDDVMRSSQGDRAIGFNSAGAWEVLNPRNSQQEECYEGFIENYLVTTDTIGAVIPQVGKVYLEKAVENKPVSYSLANYFKVAGLDYSHGKIILEEAVIRGMFTFAFPGLFGDNGAYAGKSHSLDGFFIKEEKIVNNGKIFVAKTMIEGCEEEELQKYKDEIVNRYWKAHKIIGDNKLGDSTTISIDESNDTQELTLSIRIGF